MMKIEEIRAIIPHRYPFLLIDRVLEWEAKSSLKALKNVTANEIFFNGHFPNHPVMPGVLIVEALAQAFSVLATKSYGNPDDPSKNGLFLLAGIDDTRFKRMVVPGDQLILEVQMISDKHNIFKGKGTATVNGEIACVTTLLSMREKTKMVSYD